MREQIMDLLACPLCKDSLAFEGRKMHERLLSGFLRCGRGHMFQVKEEIGFLKDVKLSADEFEWKVNVADEKKYDEIRRQYDSFLRGDQKEAIERMTQRLIDLVIESCRQSDNLVLDVASGMGRLILPLAQKSAEKMMIIGTDIDEKPLRGAMNRAKKADTWDRFSLIVTDAKHMCFKDGSLSTISSFFGFDNVPETVLALKEGARIMKADGHMFLYSLWLRENSESMRLAEKHRVCQIAGEKRLREALDRAGLVLEEVQEVYSALWPYNPMDLLPVEGDEYSHVVVRVGKRKE